jgi:TolB-like protein/Tfp pilus assembly protein PilF
LSFFAELKRRNVFRVGIAYVIGGWLLLQLTDVLSELLDLPDVVGRVVVMGVVIGLPVTLFFAWAFEMTPEGIKKEKDVDRSQSITNVTSQKLNNVIIGVLVVALSYFAIDKFILTPGNAQPGSDHFSQQTKESTTTSGEKSALTPVEAIAEAEAEPAISQQSIAVLPFENRSNREEDQFFTDGIHDDLLTTIARIGSMKVISRTSVMEYRQTTKKIPEIARELGVANILEGGIQRSGDQIRINVQLIDAKTDKHLWAEIFDRELTAKNLFAIQSEISQKIADALHTKLSPEETERINTMPTQNLAAYDAYMRGKQLLATRAASDIEESIREFRKAVDLDPEFALAWVGLADSNFLLGYYGTTDNETALAIRQEATARALEIDPGLGEAYVSLGTLLDDLGEYEEMHSAFKRAIELSPNYATAYQFYSGRDKSYTRMKEDVDLMLKAVELDPRSAIIGVNLADIYAEQGSYSRAEHQYKKVIDLNPNFSPGYGALARYYGYFVGRFDLASQNLKFALTMDPTSLNELDYLVTYSLELGDRQAALRYRLMMADANDQDWRLGFSDMLIGLEKGNAGGVREALNWMKPRVPVSTPIFPTVAMLALANGDTAEARKVFVANEPGWINPEEWESLVDGDLTSACLVAWTLTQTGDEALGAALLDQTLAFMTTLPGLLEHPDLLNAQFCYLAASDTEQALALIETQLAHNHLIWWKIYDQLAMYEQIRHEPRYLAAMTERDRRLAVQREAVSKMNAEASP